MVVSQNVLDSLKQIGLNLYERKLWVALLSRRSATAGELSNLAKVPHSRTYDVLESLAEKGFVVVQATKPLKYMAIDPAEALERAKNKIQEDANVQSHRIDTMIKSPTLKELDKVFKKGVDLVEAGDMLGSLKGRNSMHSQYETLFKGAKKSISILTTEEGLADIHVKHGDTLRKSAKRGVEIKIAAPFPKDFDTNPFKEFAKIKELKKNDAAGRMVIVDGTHAVMSMTHDKDVHPSQDLAMWSQSPHFAGDLMTAMFDRIWDKL